ncbi:MAG: hypothetical protein IH620_00255 [Ignavibacterium sp.]|nr:hypothetical protein [Ignavibacterium sp.]HCY75653.1 hypothetical protein [Ignavibacteriales bacterium]
MKTEIFETAIKNRNRLRFLYGLNEVLIEPYYLTVEKNGSKVIYGKVYQSSEIKKFNYGRIANIKVLEKRKFSPVIPIIPLAS